MSVCVCSQSEESGSTHTDPGDPPPITHTLTHTMRGAEPVKANQSVSYFVEEQWDQTVKAQSFTTVQSCTMIRGLVRTILEFPVSPSTLPLTQLINNYKHDCKFFI